MASRPPSRRNVRHASALGQSVLPVNFTLTALTVRPSPHPTHVPASTDWFPALLPTASDLSGHRCGSHQMLTLIAYDIAEPKRLHRVAKVCEDWGMRVQYSVFECRLEADAFERFWTDLLGVIDPKLDRLVAYKICSKCARDIHTAGVMVHNEQVVAYVC